jgi:hypothetical protein
MNRLGRHWHAYPCCLMLAVLCVPWPAGARSTRLFFDVHPLKVHNIKRGHPIEQHIALTNILNDVVTVKSIAIEGASRLLALQETVSVPFTLAPAERVEIPVILSGNKGSGWARLRIVASTPRSDKDISDQIKFHYEVK